MRFILFLSIMLLFQFCKSSTDLKNENTETEQQIEITAGVNQDWVTFENAVGKKPSAVGLMKAKNLQERIKILLKDEYQIFQTSWNEETPIMVEDRILFTTGCNSDDCKSNKYLLFIDIGDNNINVINFKYGKVRSWEERAVIGLPAKLLEQYEWVRKDQGL